MNVDIVNIRKSNYDGKMQATLMLNNVAVAIITQNIQIDKEVSYGVVISDDIRFKKLSKYLDIRSIDFNQFLIDKISKVF